MSPLLFVILLGLLAGFMLFLLVTGIGAGISYLLNRRKQVREITVQPHADEFSSVLSDETQRGDAPEIGTAAPVLAAEDSLAAEVEAAESTPQVQREEAQVLAEAAPAPAKSHKSRAKRKVLPRRQRVGIEKQEVESQATEAVEVEAEPTVATAASVSSGSTPSEPLEATPAVDAEQSSSSAELAEVNEPEPAPRKVTEVKPERAVRAPLFPARKHKQPESAELPAPEKPAAQPVVEPVLPVAEEQSQPTEPEPEPQQLDDPFAAVLAALGKR